MPKNKKNESIAGRRRKREGEKIKSEEKKVKKYWEYWEEARGRKNEEKSRKTESIGRRRKREGDGDRKAPLLLGVKPCNKYYSRSL